MLGSHIEGSIDFSDWQIDLPLDDMKTLILKEMSKFMTEQLADGPHFSISPSGNPEHPARIEASFDLGPSTDICLWAIPLSSLVDTYCEYALHDDHHVGREIAAELRQLADKIEDSIKQNENGGT